MVQRRTGSSIRESPLFPSRIMLSSVFQAQHEDLLIFWNRHIYTARASVIWKRARPQGICLSVNSIIGYLVELAARDNLLVEY